MTHRLERGLWLWAAALILILQAVIPLTGWVRAMVLLAVVCCVAQAWIGVAKKVARARETLDLSNAMTLPAETCRQPVLLVCGDGLDALFGSLPAQQLAVRVTEQGCYVRVPGLAQLPVVVARVLTERPEWGGLLNVMLIVNPGEHTDSAVLAGQLNALGHQLALIRTRGLALPLMCVCYIQAARGAGPWFNWATGQDGPVVHDTDSCASFFEWQRPDSSAMQAARLQTAVQVSSAAAWLSEKVFAHLTPRAARQPSGLLHGCAITLVPVLPRQVAGNLWQQWLGDKVALVESAPASSSTGTALPFPDALLHLLPISIQRSRVQRAMVIALWLLTGASLIALASSAWQNTLLVRQVSDDMRRYLSISPIAHRDQPEFIRREEAVEVLRRNAVRLDRYYRHGEPLALGLGLYRGERLRAPLLATIAAHRQPARAVIPASAAQTVRLDSLSLFSSGSAQLKPESAKVLIKALVDIKAQPGWLIVIAGHTDASGSDERNLELSRARAAAVRDWMQRIGDIPDSCFAVQGFGASQPVASNDHESGRTANRRVDIRLVPEAGACVLSTPVPGRQPLPYHTAIND